MVHWFWDKENGNLASQSLNALHFKNSFQSSKLFSVHEFLSSYLELRTRSWDWENRTPCKHDSFRLLGRLLPSLNHDDVIAKARFGLDILGIGGCAGLEVICNFLKVAVKTSTHFPA